MRFFKHIVFYYNKKYNMESIFEQLANILPSDTDNRTWIEFFFDEFPRRKSSAVGRITRAFPEMEVFHYKYLEQYTSDKNQEVNALSNLSQVWKKSNPNKCLNIINEDLLKQIFLGIPKRFPLHNAAYTYRMLNWENGTICKEMEIAKEKKQFFPYYNESSVTLNSDWHHTGRLNSITACLEIDPEYVIKTNRLYDRELETKLNQVAGRRFDRINVVNSIQEETETKKIIELVREKIKYEAQSIILNMDKLQIPNKADYRRESYAAKQYLTPLMKKIGFKYISKESQVDHYSFLKITPKNNKEKCLILLTPHSRGIDIIYELEGLNWKMDLPCNGFRIPRLQANTFEKFQESITEIIPIINDISSRIVPKVECHFPETPKWFYL